MGKARRKSPRRRPGSHGCTDVAPQRWLTGDEKCGNLRQALANARYRGQRRQVADGRLETLNRNLETARYKENRTRVPIDLGPLLSRYPSLPPSRVLSSPPPSVAMAVSWLGASWSQRSQLILNSAVFASQPDALFSVYQHASEDQRCVQLDICACTRTAS